MKKKLKTCLRKSHKIIGQIFVETLERISGAIAKGILREIFSCNHRKSLEEFLEKELISFQKMIFLGILKDASGKSMDGSLDTILEEFGFMDI